MKYSLLVALTMAGGVLAACGSGTETSEPETTVEAAAAAPAEVAALTVDVLDCGTIGVSDLDAFSSAGDYAGQTDTFTDTCYLIRHPEGTLLWDLGLPGMLTISGPQTQQIFTVSLEKTITEQVRDLGMEMSDIDYVAVSLLMVIAVNKCFNVYFPAYRNLPPEVRKKYFVY